MKTEELEILEVRDRHYSKNQPKAEPWSKWYALALLRHGDQWMFLAIPLVWWKMGYVAFRIYIMGQASYDWESSKYAAKQCWKLDDKPTRIDQKRRATKSHI